MKKGNQGLILLSGGSMALIWRYAWASWIMIAAFHRPFPLPEAIATFSLAAALSFFSLGRGLRIIQVLGLQVLGFLLAFSRIVYVFNDWSYPFLNPHWFMEFFNQTRGLLEWFSLFLIFFWAIIFWAGGVSLARRPTAYLTICARFDLGVTFFLALFLTRFIILFKGGPIIEDPLSELLVLSFFLFGLLAIGLARNQSRAQRGFLSGYRGLSVVLSFSAVVLIFAAGLLLLFYPYLTLAAEAGYGVLKIASEPLGPVLVSVLRFLFAPRSMRMDPASSLSGGGMAGSGASADSLWWAGPFGEALRFLFLIFAGLGAFILFGFLIWLLLRWLFSRTAVTGKKSDHGHLFSLLVERLKAFFCFVRRRFLGLGQRRRGAVQHYAALLRWGRRSGMPRFSSETPMEYGLRLKCRFPALKREIESITEIFNQEVYGGIVADGQPLALVQKAWRQLRSPLHWFDRLKVWFFQADKEGVF